MFRDVESEDALFVGTHSKPSGLHPGIHKSNSPEYPRWAALGSAGSAWADYHRHYSETSVKQMTGRTSSNNHISDCSWPLIRCWEFA